MVVALWVAFLYWIHMTEFPETWPALFLTYDDGFVIVDSNTIVIGLWFLLLCGIVIDTYFTARHTN